MKLKYVAWYHMLNYFLASGRNSGVLLESWSSIFILYVLILHTVHKFEHSY